MKNLKEELLLALAENDETMDDIVFCSHPLEMLDHSSTLEEIQCDYLNGAYGWHIHNAPDKQGMPFVAATHKHWYSVRGERRHKPLYRMSVMTSAALKGGLKKSMKRLVGELTKWRKDGQRCLRSGLKKL